MYKHVNLIIHVPDLTPLEASILCWLANHANTNGIAFPGVMRLMRESRLCKRTVYTTLQRLEKKHLITRLDTPPPEARRRTAYAMTYAEAFLSAEPVVVREPVLFTPDEQPSTNGHKPAALVASAPETDAHRGLHPEPLTPEQIEDRRAKMREAMARLSASKTMEKGKRNGKAPNL